MDISIIICTYNRCRSLETVLESIQKLDIPPALTWETLVVDNNSRDATRETVEKFTRFERRNITYIFEGRQGKSHALNTGIAAAKGEILAFTDDDVTIDPSWLINIKKTFDTYDCAGIGGKIVPVFPGKKPYWVRTDSPFPYMNVLGSFDYGDECLEFQSPPYGANMAFRKTVFAVHGQFRTDLGPTEGNLLGKGEDSEISLRLLKRGEKLRYVPDAVVYHRVQDEKLTKKSFQSYYFNYGRFRARTGCVEFPRNAVCYFGVPRFMFRILFRKYLDWVLSFDGKHRMTLKLDYYEFLGRITEYMNSRKALQP